LTGGIYLARYNESDLSVGKIFVRCARAVDPWRFKEGIEQSPVFRDGASALHEPPEGAREKPDVLFGLIRGAELTTGIRYGIFVSWASLGPSHPLGSPFSIGLAIYLKLGILVACDLWRARAFTGHQGRTRSGGGGRVTPRPYGSSPCLRAEGEQDRSAHNDLERPLGVLHGASLSSADEQTGSKPCASCSSHGFPSSVLGITNSSSLDNGISRSAAKKTQAKTHLRLGAVLSYLDPVVVVLSRIGGGIPVSDIADMVEVFMKSQSWHGSLTTLLLFD